MPNCTGTLNACTFPVDEMRTKQTFFAAGGALMVALGVVGIVVPLLPTTPFLLLAAYLFAGSSPRCHVWLLRHKHLGPYIHAFRRRTGLTGTQKLRIGASLSLAMGVSVYFAPILFIKCTLLGVWAFWSVLLLRTKTAPEPIREPR